MINKLSIVSLLYILIFSSCAREKKNEPSTPSGNKFFEVSNFKFNISSSAGVLSENDTTVLIPINLEDAMDGIEFPSDQEAITFSFKIKNLSTEESGFRYKIIYQNESYKFNEWDSLGNYNYLSSENFYGSWPDTLTSTRKTPVIKPSESIEIIDSLIKITGNPRFERKYYSNGINNRWQRNPRVGEYRFYLLLWKDRADNEIPDHVKNLHIPEDSIYRNPLFYCFSPATKRSENFLALRSAKSLTLRISLKPENGIYIEPEFSSKHPIVNNTESCCGQTVELYRSAHFQQFFHTIVSTTGFDNIPVISDVLKENYSHLDYNWNKNFFKKEELIRVRPSEPRNSCETVSYNAATKSIRIFNPKSVPGGWRKENTGVKTRHGLTYGKFRVKCKLTELLNKDQMWNGITNAIWLINQSNAAWNSRRSCDKYGYMSNYLGGETDSRSPVISYSEIDFEILKSYRYCPSNLFPPVYSRSVSDKSNKNSWNKNLPEEIAKLEGSIMVNCTNWDMACADPVNFKAGCNPIVYNGEEFQAHRWDTTYRATTISTPAPDDELFAGSFYYFEIEWKPDEIIWRIGPDPKKMKVVGYMNSTITSIPNNQMLLIIDQEFHNTKWWIGSPYSQDNIPFPKNDITGDIFEVTIE